MFYKELVNKELFNDNSQRNKSHNGLIIEKNRTGDLFLSNRLKTSFVGRIYFLRHIFTLSDIQKTHKQRNSGNTQNKVLLNILMITRCF